MAQTHDSQQDETSSAAVRLQKALASAGVGSRRHCEEYITTGRVSVDGKQVTDLGTRVDPDSQKIHVDGELVRVQPKRYYLLNKPPGFVCTTRDPAGRPRAIDLIADEKTRLFTVGRLDENSRGLLLVTNDGEMSNRLAHPRYGARRTYRVQVVGKPKRDTLLELKRGMHFTEGKFRFREIKQVASRGKSTFLELVLTEGQNREIRRLLARVGHKVIDLQRTGFGPLKLGRLPEGRHRPLKPNELKDLRNLLAGRDNKGRPTKKKTAGRPKRKSSRRTDNYKTSRSRK